MTRTRAMLAAALAVALFPSVARAAGDWGGEVSLHIHMPARAEPIQTFGTIAKTGRLHIRGLGPLEVKPGILAPYERCKSAEEKKYCVEDK